MDRLARILKFSLERWIQRGVLHQLTFAAALVVVISAAGGLLAWALTDQFDDPLAAIWWSFLRLTDPGYLGDDEGAALRVLSTAVTVSGYVLFMGSLIAIMTEWLARTLRRLESGLTPISMRGHVVILGWTNRTARIARQLLGAQGRLRRFLAERDLRVLRIVVVAPEVDGERRDRLRVGLGDAWREGQVLLRAGSELELDDLRRFDLRRAAAIIVPGDEFAFGDADASDTRVVKSLLNLRPFLDGGADGDGPAVVAEILDPARVRVARNALGRPVEVVVGDAVISRLVALALRDPRLAPVFQELLSHRIGCALYVRGFPELAGARPRELDGRFASAVVLGFVRRRGRGWNTHLNPPPDATLEPDDQLVLLARCYEDCGLGPPPAGAGPQAPPAAGEPAAGEPATDEPATTLRVLVLGWGHKMGAVLRELGRSGVPYELTLVSRGELADREDAFEDLEPHGSSVTVRNVYEDYVAPGVLEELAPWTYERVILLASDRAESREIADARTILGHGLLRAVLDEGPPGAAPDVVVELVDASNARLFTQRRSVLLVTPELLSHVQAHVALRPELNSVFEALFVAEGAGLALRPPATLGLAGGDRFQDAARAAVGRGEVALGLHDPEEGLELSPSPDRALGRSDVVVLTASGPEGATR